MVNHLSRWLPAPKPLLRTLHNAFLWRSCLLCEQLAHQLPLCRDCHADLPWNLVHCSRCALPLAATQNSAHICAHCTAQPPLFTRTLAPLRYEFPVDHLIAGLKYHRQLAHAPLLGKLLLQHLQERGISAPDIVLPVPLHPQRLGERGYNQALEIARPLARAFACPLETTLLHRAKNTAPQMALNAGEREKNPQHAFVINEQRLQQLGRIQRVAVIDDVMTTGATLREITQKLLNAGVAEVELWVVARTA